MAFTDEEKFLQAFQLKAGIDVTKPENAWVKSLFTVAKKYVDEEMIPQSDPTVIYDYILRDTTSPELEPFRVRFSAYMDEVNKAKAGGTIPVWKDVSEYLNTEQDYIRAIKSKPGFADLATIDNVKKFIAGGNSVSEISSRIDDAFYTVQTADAALKEQLQSYYPTLNDADLAKALVTGSTTDVEQKIKTSTAAIQAEQKLAGLAGQDIGNVADLAKQGVTRAEAKKAFQQVKAQQTGIEQAARTFGRTAPTAAQQTSEALGLTQEPSIKGLRSQARAEFAGGTGITTGSLRKKNTLSSQL